MKVIFLRHGESYDDVQKQFGGWSDQTPTPAGIVLAKEIGLKFREQYPDIEQILTSPLKRASVFASQVGRQLQKPVREVVYLKERNTYGLLNGLKEGDLADYPELQGRLDAQEFIPGSERYEDFVERVDFLLNYLSELKTEGTILCVTHGFLITTLVEEYLGLIRDEISYGCYILCELSGKSLSLLESNGLSFLESPVEEKQKLASLRKFKQQ